MTLVSVHRQIPHTLVLEHVSPATRLLEKRRQMFEVQEALEQQKQDYARKVPWPLAQGGIGAHRVSAGNMDCSCSLIAFALQPLSKTESSVSGSCLCAVHGVYTRTRSCSLIASALRPFTRTESNASYHAYALFMLYTCVPPGAQEEVFQRREEGLKKKDLELQASLIRFSKFLQARVMRARPTCLGVVHAHCTRT